jgi:hypothetical protein
MSKFGIQEPCQENREGMKHNSNGAFCGSCEKQVFDATKMTKPEIMGLMKRFETLPCMRLTAEMNQELADDYDFWLASKDSGFQKRFMLALIIVFGFTLLSCNNEPQREAIQTIQTIGNEFVKEEGEVPKPKEVLNPSENKVEVLGKPEKIEMLMGEVVEIPETSVDLDEVRVGVEDQVRIITGAINGRVLAGIPSRSYTMCEFIAEQDSTEVSLQYDDLGREIPKEYNLLAYPNPFQYETTLKVELPKETQFQLSVYNLEGKLIQDFGMQKQKPGTFEYDLNLIDAAPGVYLIHLKSEAFSVSKRVVKR